MNNLRQAIEEADAQCYVLEPGYFDEAAIDLAHNAEGQLCVRYNAQKVVELLIKHEAMDHEDALEWFSFNIECANLGAGSPIYVDPDAPDETDE